MSKRDNDPRPRRYFLLGRGLALVLLLLGASPAFAIQYGEVIVAIEDEPREESKHGYKEYWLRIDNKSESKNHVVKLSLPRPGETDLGDPIRAVTRTVTVEPGKSVRVSLAYPERFSLAGSEIGVAIDGSEQKTPIPLSLSPSGRYSSSLRHTSFSYVSRSESSPLVLCSKDIDPRFLRYANQSENRIANPWEFPEEKTKNSPEQAIIPAGSGSNPQELAIRQPVTHINFVTAALPPASWSPNWLGYSRYDGIIVTAADLRAMTAEARAAIGQYVECGGSLLIFGDDPTVPDNWRPQPVIGLPIKASSPGFGHCFVSSEKDYTKMNLGALFFVETSWYQTMEPWQRQNNPAEANRSLPVIEDIGIPVRGLVALMIVFAITIGPVNLIVLTRTKRRLWLFWTVPVLSFFTCVMVMGFMIVSEGWEVRRRAECFTILDENSHRASTLGCLGVYAPLLPGEGLRFSAQTEVSYQDEQDNSSYGYRHNRSGPQLSMDWSRDQHLVSGWMTPRAPSHFLLRKSETRRERVTIAPGSDGCLEAMNGLGAEIAEFWYMNESGVIFSAEHIPAGGRVTLNQKSKPATRREAKALRQVYLHSYLDAVNHVHQTVTDLLAPRTYLAFLDGTPFLDDDAAKGASNKSRSAVFGILKEGNDGG